MFRKHQFFSQSAAMTWCCREAAKTGQHYKVYHEGTMWAAYPTCGRVCKCEGSLY